MRRIHLATAAALGLAACLAGSALPAFADQGKSVVKATRAPAGAAGASDKAPGVDPKVTTSPPAGYVRVASAPFTASSGSQSAGSVSCPGKKVPLGGGVTIASSDLNDNINTSYPAGNGWVADVNIGGAATSFTVYAICATKPTGYKVVSSGSLPNAPGQTGGSVSCPGAKVPWSGGFYSASGSGGVNVNSTYPSGPQTWQVFMNNSTVTSTSFIVYAVCAARPHLYGQSYGASTSRPVSEDLVLGTCGQGQVVVGGGAYSSSASVYVNLNSTEPYTSTQWASWMNNNTTSSPSLLTYATCVGI